MNIKSVKKLHEKKGRKESGLFLVEGIKSVLELLDSDFEIKEVYVTHPTWNEHKDKFANRPNIHKVDAGELAKMSTLEFNNTALAVAKQKESKPALVGQNEIVLALDDIRDPGNLGTIIRTADWYGIKKIIASSTTAEFYNPKTIAATMGSFTRVHIEYADLESFFSETALPIIGADMDGTDAHAFKYPKSGILLMGNEANGIHSSLLPLITDKVTIPRYGSAESLNVAMATGILLDNWKRNK